MSDELGAGTDAGDGPAARPELTANHFELFGVPARFDVDEATLAPRYRELQSATHPDRFANASAAERRWSQQASGRVNEAWRTLTRPLSRATYLLSLHGVDIDAETDTRMDPAFLMEQMELREALEAIPGAGDPMAAADAVSVRLGRMRADEAERFAAATDASDWGVARDVVRRWQFVDKLARELGEIEARLEDG